MFSSTTDQTVDKDAQIISGERQLKAFGQFLENYEINLLKLKTFHNQINDDGFSDSAGTFAELSKRTTNQSFMKPIQMDFTNHLYENLTIFQLIDSDNKILNKILLTFVQLCLESEKLCTDAENFHLEFLYFDDNLLINDDEYQESSDAVEQQYQQQTENIYIKISNSLEFLCNIQYLIQRLIIIASTILQQLNALFLNDKNLLGMHLTIQFQAVFDSLTNLIVQLIIFDEIFMKSNFVKYWPSYKKMINSLRKNFDKKKFDDICSDFEITSLINILNELELLFSGNLFQSFLDSTFKLKEEQQQNSSAKGLNLLSEHFQDYIKMLFSNIDKFQYDLSEFNETKLIININLICILYHNYFGQLDQKTFKNLIDCNLKHVGITLIGNIIWCPETFLYKYAETLMKNNYEKIFIELKRLRQVNLQTKINNLLKDTKSYCLQITLWSLKMNVSLKTCSYDLKLEQFKNICNLFLNGIQYAGQLLYIIKSIINLHILLHIPIQKHVLLNLCKLIEYFKIIQNQFLNDFDNIIIVIKCIIQYLQYKALFIINTVKKKITNETTTYNEHNLDILSSLQIAEKSLYGPATKLRLLIINLSINAANSNRSIISQDLLKKLQRILQRLFIISNLQTNLDKLFIEQTTIIYWNQKTILSIYLKSVIDKQIGHNSFHYILKTSNDCLKNFNQLNLNKLKLYSLFKTTNYEQLKLEIIEKLCGQIETFLRLEVHTTLHEKSLIKSLANEVINDYRDLINIRPIQMNEDHIMLKDHIENYLSNMFYNLTTISLHDWKTYGEMRQLANYTFNLDTIDDNLPTQTLEQGIDVLEIMRNIHVFVSKYLYNMHNQIFIEIASNNKHLNTIGIKHIANSLRTHGTGIINTTVNFTYQFLRKKFYTFSQFMFDEQIKSRLMKDLKYFRDNKDKLNQMYNYERADHFNKGIRKLGLTPDGLSYLDLFRQLITHIGNAMGYIRLIRSGSIHANYSASVYLPQFDDDDNLEFSKLTIEQELNRTTQDSAKNFEMNIKNLSKNFTEGTEYFRLLVDAFSTYFRDPKNLHLKNFYLIIPPLMINYVEYMLQSKDKINKKNKTGALFIDDGFSIGLTYILKLLNQINEFNSLHWFKVIKLKYLKELELINQQRAELKLNTKQNNYHDNDKLNETLTLSEKRINSYQIEFNLLYYSLSSSKIFFQ